MKNKPVLSYMLALLGCLAIGLIVAGLIRLWDAHMDYPDALTQGETLAFPVCGFSLIAPEGAWLEDLTQLRQEAESDLLYAARIHTGVGEIHLSCYPNGNGDAISDHEPQALIGSLLAAGAQEPRMRTFGGRAFIQYASEDSALSTRRYTYETWNPSTLILIETTLTEPYVIPILGSIAFTDAQP